MADSGIRHVVSSVPVPKTAYEAEDHHALIHGTSFPASPVERQLYYRDDLHKWYIYNGSSWVETTSQGVTVHNDLTGRDAAGCHPLSAISPRSHNTLTDRDAESCHPLSAISPRSHNTLTDRDAAGCHPFTAISGAVHDNTYHSPDFATEAAFLAHVSRHERGGADPLPLDILVQLLKEVNFVIVPTSAGWDEVPIGAGRGGQEPMRNYVIIEDVNAGSALLRTTAFGFNAEGIFSRIRWDKPLYFMFNYGLGLTEANLERRIQLKAGNTMGQLAVQGIGFEVIDQAMVGEGYGTARGTVSLGTYSMSPDYKQYNILIELDPATPAINFYVNGSLAGAITNTNYIPSGLSPGSAWLLHSIYRAAGGKANVFSVFMHGKIWQEM